MGLISNARVDALVFGNMLFVGVGVAGVWWWFEYARRGPAYDFSFRGDCDIWRVDQHTIRP